MGNNGVKVGKCYICGKNGKLSKEHVPPQSAFNKQTLKIISGEDIFGRNELPWVLGDLKGKTHQGGVGWYRLCEKCNNNTGVWYVPEYVKFVTEGYSQIQKAGFPEKVITLNYKNIYPSRFVREILAMFATTGGPDVLDKQPNIRKIILDREFGGIDTKKYFIGMYVNKSPLLKYTGMTASGNLATGEMRLIAEIAGVPFGFILELNPKKKDKNYCDITELLNKFSFNDQVDIEMTVPVYENNTGFPADHRTKEEIIEHRKLNEQK